MIYYQDEHILIRNLQQSDARIITEEIAQGWHANIKKYEMLLKDQSEGRSISAFWKNTADMASAVSSWILSNSSPQAIRIPFISESACTAAMAAHRECM